MRKANGSNATVEMALSGFRLVRERPKLIAAWSLPTLAFNLAGSLFAASTCGHDIMRVVGAIERGDRDTVAAADLLGRVAPTYLVLLVATLAVHGVYLAAANRAFSRPADDRAGYLGLGRDELRQFALTMLLWSLGSTVAFAILILATAIGLGTRADVADVIGAACVVVAIGYLCVRLSLASPMTFTTGRVDLGQAWRLTQGHFWRLASAYLLAALLAVLVYLLGAAVIGLGMSAAVGGASRLQPLVEIDLSSPAAVLTPARLVLAVLQAVLSALLLPIVLCPPIEAYRSMSPAPPPSTSAAPGGSSPWQ